MRVTPCILGIFAEDYLTVCGVYIWVLCSVPGVYGCFKTISFIIALKKMKYLQISLTKEEKDKDLYTKNCETLTKEIQGEQRSRKTSQDRDLEELI